jgi:hypothetical protein
MTAIDPDVRIVLEQVDASVPAPGGLDVAFHGFHFFADALPRAREEVTAELEAVRRGCGERAPRGPERGGPPVGERPAGRAGLGGTVAGVPLASGAGALLGDVLVQHAAGSCDL